MSDEYREAVKMLRQACADGLIESTAPSVQGQMVERVVQFARQRAAEELRAAAATLRSPDGWIAGRVLDIYDALYDRAEALAHHEEAL